MTKARFDIGIVRSHIHDLDANNRSIFSRDCAELFVETGKGAWPGKSPKRWTVYDELEKRDSCGK